jgi:hypothetical protein
MTNIIEHVFSVSDYSFPYIVIILSVISNAAHFAYKLDQVSICNKRKTGNKKYELLQATQTLGCNSVTICYCHTCPYISCGC